MFEVSLHDGQPVEVEVVGTGPAILIPAGRCAARVVRPVGSARLGGDPDLGAALVAGLSDRYQVIAFDYADHLTRYPKPATLTPAHTSRDLLAVADAAGADRFAYYGYSWLGMLGLQLAIRTGRLTALMIGGFPPLDGPYRTMVERVAAAYERAVGAARPDGRERLLPMQVHQFLTLYRALQDFDDRAAQALIDCPRLCFVGSADEIGYGEPWGPDQVSVAGPVLRHAAELETLGWQVGVLDGLDHQQAMQPVQVLPLLRRFLAGQFGTG